MGEAADSVSGLSSLRWAAQYHYDVVRSLHQYFKPGPTQSTTSHATFPKPGEGVQLAAYMKETDLRSSLAILTSIEAAFQLDYQYRCRQRLEDDLSLLFRSRYRQEQSFVSLEKVIFDAWSNYETGAPRLIAELRGAFRYRHWLAHGRYWPPKLGRRYDFEYLYRLAYLVFLTLPLNGVDEA
jgi:hypothetical protein